MNSNNRVNNEDIDYIFWEAKNYLTIEALEDGLTAKLSRNVCEYCIDEDMNWIELSPGSYTESINAGQTLSFRGNLIPDSSNGIGTFTISKKCNVLGNVMSMLFGDDAYDSFSLSGKDYAFYRLFEDCINIISAKDLILPATALADYCYYQMFLRCESLTTAPELPATKLARNCYDSMFKGCTLLNYIKMLATDISAIGCLNNWVENIASIGTFIKHPNMTSLITGTSGIPSGWDVVDVA